MSDIALLPAPIGAYADVTYMERDAIRDDGLDTAVYLSLFTDARNAESGEGGYWGDAVDDQPSGSLLWTVARTVMADALPLRVKEICADALQWLLDYGIADAVTVDVAVTGRFSLSIAVEIAQSGDARQYSYNWQAQAAAGF